MTWRHFPYPHITKRSSILAIFSQFCVDATELNLTSQIWPSVVFIISFWRCCTWRYWKHEMPFSATMRPLTSSTLARFVKATRPSNCCRFSDSWSRHIPIRGGTHLTNHKVTLEKRAITQTEAKYTLIKSYKVSRLRALESVKTWLHFTVTLHWQLAC